VSYTICEITNPSNCDSVTETVTVSPPAIDAIAETFSAINGATGGATPTILGSDTLNGAIVDPADVALTIDTLLGPDSNPTTAITVNPDGTVTVPANTAAGDYQVSYTICEVANPANCDSVAETITVAAPGIDAIVETFTAINGTTGGTTPTVLSSDTLNGAFVDAAEVTLVIDTLLDPDGNPTSAITVNPDGTVTVPANTAAGDYQLTYTICEITNPTNCDSVTETITVTTPGIDAIVETFTPINGATGGATPTILTSDTLNDVVVDPADVTLTIDSLLGPNGNATSAITVNPAGTVTVPANTAAGDYQVAYTICEITNPTNCDSVTETVTVVPPAINAIVETFGAVNGATGGSTPTILTSDTLNGVVVDPADITLAIDTLLGPGGNPTSAITVNPDGTITVTANTTAGDYQVSYTICEVINPTNCDSVTETITVAAAGINAIMETFTVINGATGGTTLTILSSDTLNGAFVDPADVALTIDTLLGPDGNPTSTITVNPDGTITVPATTAAGDYQVSYTICEVANPTNCDSVPETVTVAVAAPGIDAIAETFNPISGTAGGITPTILASDTLNGAVVNPADVTLVIDTLLGPDGNPTTAITVNSNGMVTVPANTAIGNYQIAYTICEISNPTNCDSVIEMVMVITTAPELGVVKSVIAVDVMQSNGTFDVTYQLLVENTGDVRLSALSLSDELSAPTQLGTAFRGVTRAPEVSLAANASGNAIAPSTAGSAFTGTGAGAALLTGSDGQLDPGDRYQVTFAVNIDANAEDAPAVLANIATVSGTPPSGAPVVDNSDTGTDPDGNPTGATPDDNPNGPGSPTLITAPTEDPQLGLAKQATVNGLLADGSFDVTFTLLVENLGNVQLTQLTLEDDLSAASNLGSAFVGLRSTPVIRLINTSGNSVAPSLSSSFTGTTGAANLLTGLDGLLQPNDQFEITFTATVNPSAVGAPAELINQANAGGTSPGGALSFDLSDNGAQTSGPNTGGTDDDPTPISVPVLTPLVVTKTTSTPAVSPGEFASYSVSVTNPGVSPAIGVTLSDDLPGGFGYVVDSAQLLRAGVASPALVTGVDPIAVEIGSLAGGESVVITYLSRVGAGIVAGEHTNTASALVFGVVSSNTATATVTFDEDPLLSTTRIIGKVWHDRDGDGWQDAARATNIKLSGGPFAEPKTVQNLPGRRSASDEASAPMVRVAIPGDWPALDSVKLTTAQGTVLHISNQGAVEEHHRGQKKRGRTAQNLQVSLTSARTGDRKMQAPSYLEIHNLGVDEEGLPGVRLATVEGLLIETDQSGRYHIEEIDDVAWDIGSNYIVKVDPITLPDGSTFTTENPRVERLTQSLMSDISFGVQIPQGNWQTASCEANAPEPVDLIAEADCRPPPTERLVHNPEQVTETIANKVSEVRFASGKSDIPTAAISSLRSRIAKLDSKKNLRLRFIGHADSQALSARSISIYGTNKGLSEARAREVAERFQQTLGIASSMIEVVGRGDSQPIADNGTPEGMALNRRVEIEVVYDEIVGTTGTSVVEKTIPLDTIAATSNPTNGVVRAIEDRAQLDPRLAVVANVDYASPDTASIEFHRYSNYPAFVARFELNVFSGDDIDRIRPIVTLTDEPDSQLDVSGSLTWTPEQLRAGENYAYVLSAIGADGQVDTTHPRTIRVLPADEINADAEPVNPMSIYGTSGLARQTIPVNGGRVRVWGLDLVPAHTVTVAGEAMQLDDKGEFVLEAHLPQGSYRLPVVNRNPAGSAMRQELNVEVSDSYLFMVGLANVTFGGNDIDSVVEPLAADDRFSSSTYTSGRLGFYLKGKIKGKYLITAQLDSTEDELSNLGDNLRREDPSSVFRRLEADQYYPVYGDDSTTRKDTESIGAGYVRIDWNKSKALWGNFETGITGNEFAQYNRSLYGAQLVYRTNAVTRQGENRASLTAFASEANSVAAHNEFEATGGSLYYLRNTDIVRGSEKVWIEVRRRDTLVVIEQIILQPGEDYEFDHIQGRILLNRPLSQITRNRNDAIVRDRALEGDRVFLIANYEFVPSGFESDNLTAGVRGHYWVNSALGLGGTYINESRAGVDYSLAGGDITLRHGEGTYLKLEAATSESNQTVSLFSNNGGLTFDSSPLAATSEGDAFGVEARLNLADISERQGIAKVWYKNREAGFSSSRETLQDNDTTDMGFEVDVQLNERVKVIARGNELERENLSKDRVLSLQSEMRVTQRLDVGVEVRDEQRDLQIASAVGGTSTVNADATLIGARVNYALDEDTSIYAEGQTSTGESAAFEDNDLVAVGVQTRVSEALGLGVEVSEGDRGSALMGTVDYRINDQVALDVGAGLGNGAYGTAGATINLDNGYQLYGSYGIDPDRTVDRQRNVTTIGQRLVLGNGAKLFNEHQWTRSEAEDGITNVFGIDYAVNEYTSLSATLQRGELEIAGVETNRDAASVGVAIQRDSLRLGSRIEWRRDENPVNEFEQWLSSNSIEWKYSESLRLLSKINYSETEDQLTGDDAARLAEASLGFAYRPVGTNRWNILGRYTFLDDLVAPGQVLARPDQRSHVASVESLYKLSSRWEFGLKLAIRRGEIRINRDSGQWFDSGLDIAVGRARYHFAHKWDGLLEYRYVANSELNDARSGALIGMYRHLGRQLKLGAGYNFTDYSEDLTNLDYNNGGWYLDLVGKF